MRLLDDASAAIQYNRDLLQSAIDNVGQGIAVFDADMDAESAGTAAFRSSCRLSAESGPRRRALARNRPRTSCARRTAATAEPRRPAAQASPRCMNLSAKGLQRQRQVIEVRSSPMPDGGVVVTFTDVTDSVRAAEALRKANETLERRVAERTAELTRLNAELAMRQGPRPRRPISARPASSPPPATTFCSRSMRRDSSPPAWSSSSGARTKPNSSAMSMPRWKRWRKSSRRCSTFPASMPAS